jgi:hypothetical protein
VSRREEAPAAAAARGARAAVAASIADAKVALMPETPYRWRIAPRGAMRVPGIVFATRELLPTLADDPCLQQVANVATLPGIVEASYAMPDVHWGYGFPIGGVAATDVEAGGVVSPGGVGFDISCGVRILLAPLDGEELRPRLGRLMDLLGSRIPKGAGPGGAGDRRWAPPPRRRLRGRPRRPHMGHWRGSPRPPPREVGSPQTSTMTRHHQPLPLGAKTSSCHVIAFGVGPTISTPARGTAVKVPCNPTPASSGVSIVRATGIIPWVSTR